MATPRSCRAVLALAAVAAAAVFLLTACGGAGSPPQQRAEGHAGVERFAVPAGSGPHDVAPAPDGTVWYTAQRTGALGRLDPGAGTTHDIPLGPGSAPHGVIIGPDGAPWVTDSGLNAIVRVDPATGEVRRFPLPANRPAVNLNTAAFDIRGVLWFTGQSGVYGRLETRSGRVEVFDAPRGPGPYGITATPDGTVWYASLAGNHIARVDPMRPGHRVGAPDAGAGGAARVGGLSRSGVGQRVECRPGGRLRPRHPRLA